MINRDSNGRFIKGNNSWKLRKKHGHKKGEFKHSEEIKKKISENTKKAMENLSSDSKRRMSEAGKGRVPWNKNTKGVMKSNKTSFKKGDMADENNFKWKGDNVGYGALHGWIKRKKGSPVICQNCNSTKKLEWANINHKYSRNLDEWVSLCVPCHRSYDKSMRSVR